MLKLNDLANGTFALSAFAALASEAKRRDLRQILDDSEAGLVAALDRNARRLSAEDLMISGFPARKLAFDTVSGDPPHARTIKRYLICYAGLHHSESALHMGPPEAATLFRLVRADSPRRPQPDPGDVHGGPRPGEGRTRAAP